MAFREIQLGKKGITDNFIEGLRNHFKTCQTIKVSVLKSCCRDQEELKKIKQEILDKLGKNFTARRIGYTISFKKWRRDMRE